jgi:YidC/Oxa1 family membrane protein insertase
LDITYIWNSLVVEPLMHLLSALAAVSGSGGLAIILMTVLIKTVLLPLSLKQTSSMKAMQTIQPEVKALQKRIKDKEKLQQEIFKLYKERGYNPASGCLPMVPMMIVLIGLYGALNQLAQCDPARDNTPAACDHRFTESFLYMKHLDKPDLLFSVPDHSDKRIDIPDPLNTQQTRAFMVPSQPGAHRELDDPWHPGEKIAVEALREPPEQLRVSYTVKPDATITVPDPHPMTQGFLPHIPGLDIPIPFILPILMAISQYFSSKMMAMPSTDPQQQMMSQMTTVIMPAMMLFWGATFPAGLVLYWFVSNIYEMARLKLTMGNTISLVDGPRTDVATESDGQAGGENGARPRQSNGESAVSGARGESRPGRSRQKRGRRSGRR